MRLRWADIKFSFDNGPCQMIFACWEEEKKSVNKNIQGNWAVFFAMEAIL